jgi:hypothetical protein
LKGFYDSLGRATRTTEAVMAAKEIAVKKYVVRLRDDEREQLAKISFLAFSTTNPRANSHSMIAARRMTLLKR